MATDPPGPDGPTGVRSIRLLVSMFVVAAAAVVVVVLVPAVLIPVVLIPVVLVRVGTRCAVTGRRIFGGRWNLSATTHWTRLAGWGRRPTRLPVRLPPSERLAAPEMSLALIVQCRGSARSEPARRVRLPVRDLIIVQPFIGDIVVVQRGGQVARGGHENVVGARLRAESAALEPIADARNPTTRHSPIRATQNRGMSVPHGRSADRANRGRSAVIRMCVPNCLLGAPMPPGTGFKILRWELEPAFVTLSRECCRRPSVVLCPLVIGLDCRIAERSTQHRKAAHRIGA
jgi:hypothetical protein